MIFCKLTDIFSSRFAPNPFIFVARPNCGQEKICPKIFLRQSQPWTPHIRYMGLCKCIVRILSDNIRAWDHAHILKIFLPICTSILVMKHMSSKRFVKKQKKISYHHHCYYYQCVSVCVKFYLCVCAINQVVVLVV